MPTDNGRFRGQHSKPSTAGMVRSRQCGIPAYELNDLTAGAYILVAEPPVPRADTRGRIEPPNHDGNGRISGYVPLRYPPVTPEDPQPVITNRPSAQVHADFQLHRVTLHHVAGTGRASAMPAESHLYCPLLSVTDVNGGSSYPVEGYGVENFHGGPFDGHFDAWLPNGSYALSLSCMICGDRSCGESFDAESVVDIADADIDNLSIAAPDKATIELTIHATRSAPCDPQDLGCEAESDLWPMYLRRLANGPFGRPEHVETNIVPGRKLKPSLDRQEGSAKPPGPYGTERPLKDRPIGGPTTATGRSMPCLSGCQAFDCHH
jgi:hypothetical protein